MFRTKEKNVFGKTMTKECGNFLTAYNKSEIYFEKGQENLNKNKNTSPIIYPNDWMDIKLLPSRYVLPL